MSRLFFGLLLNCIILAGLISAKSVADYGDGKPFHLKLTEAELRGIETGQRLDYEYSEDVGQFVGEFFHDSKSQLIVDLDLFREIWTEINKMKESAIDGDVDYVQTVVEFFKPLENYDISAPCLADLTHFLWTTYNYAKTAKAASNCGDCGCKAKFKTDFRQYQWIFDVVDAMGKIPAALVSGNNLWTGSWQTCRKISAIKNQQGQLWNGQYCMARFQPYNRYNPLKAFVAPKVDPAAVCTQNISHLFEEWSEEDRKCFDLLPLLNLGLCIPDTCTNYDAERLIQFLYNSAETALGKKLVCNVDVQCSNAKPENQLWNDSLSVFVLCFILFILGLLFFGTCYDLYVARPLEAETEHQRNKQKRHELIKQSLKADTDLEEDHSEKASKISSSINLQPQGLFVTLVMMFSVPRKFVDHMISDNLVQTLHEFPKYFYNQFVVQAPLAVDSFFFLSGLLTSYIFLGKLKRNQIRLTAITTWIAYFFRRYLRLTPVYVVIMLLSVTLSLYVSEGPFWRAIDANLCKNSWWTNLLYINNFVMQDDACMGWTWYMANDFQLYMFAPILIVLLHNFRFKLGGVLIGILLLVLSSAYNLYITIVKGYPPAPILTSRLQIVAVLGDYWADLYVKPYIRCGPYIIGCLVAYVLLEKKQNPFKLSVTQWILGWGINSILGIYSVFGLFHYTKTGEISDWWAVLYTLAGRPAFAVCLGWITFACETNHGKTVNSVLGHKMFIPLSKLTFCAYLVHPLLLQLYYLSRPNAFHFTHSFQLLHMFFVAVFMSYAVALVFSLAFEMPVMHVDKLLFGGADGSKRRQQQPASSDGIIGQPTGQPNKRTAESNQEKKKTQQGLQPASNGSNEANEKLLKEYKPSLISEVDQ